MAHGDIKVGLISKPRPPSCWAPWSVVQRPPLIELLDDAEVAGVAANALKKTLLMFDYFNDVAKGQGRQRQGQGSDAELGRCRVVHQPP